LSLRESPERIDRPSDVYALGMVLHELCGEGPDELGAVIARALRPHSDERFATAADLAEALDDVAAHHRWRASPLSTAAYLAETFATRTPRRRRVAPRARSAARASASAACDGQLTPSSSSSCVNCSSNAPVLPEAIASSSACFEG